MIKRQEKIERRFTRSHQPATVFFGDKELQALDWSPEGFRLGTELSIGYENKWYPIKMIVQNEQGKVIFEGEAQARWSTSGQSGFRFRSTEKAVNKPNKSPQNDQVKAPTGESRALEDTIITPANALVRELASKAEEMPKPTDNTDDSNDPPTLTWVIKNGQFEAPEPSAASNDTFTGEIEIIQETPQDTIKAISRVFYPKVRVTAPFIGSVHEAKGAPGMTADKGDVLVLADKQIAAEKLEKLKSIQNAHRERLSSIQSSLIEWENLAKRIDSDSDNESLALSRKEVTLALAALNKAHDLQKRCQAPLDHYIQANKKYRKCREKHLGSMKQAEAESTARSQKQHAKILEKTKSLREKHSQTMEYLNKVSRKLKAVENTDPVAVKAPFKARVKGVLHSGKSFSKNDALIILENLERPILETLVPSQDARRAKIGDVISIRFTQMGMLMDGTVQYVSQKPNKEQLKGLKIEEIDDDEALVQIALTTQSERMENYADLENAPVVIEWPETE